KSTIDSVREGTHWNTANLSAMDPVTLGLCSQIDLDLEVKRAAKGAPGGEETERGTMLLTAEEALASSAGRGAPATAEETPSRRPEHEEELDADSVFAKLKSLRGSDEDAE